MCVCFCFEGYTWPCSGLTWWDIGGLGHSVAREWNPIQPFSRQSTLPTILSHPHLYKFVLFWLVLFLSCPMSSRPRLVPGTYTKIVIEGWSNPRKQKKEDLKSTLSSLYNLFTVLFYLLCISWSNNKLVN